MTRRLLPVTALLALLPALAAACPVCFGADGDSRNLGAAFNIAITLLLGVTMALIGGGIAWFRRIEARRIQLDARYIELVDLARRDDDAPWPSPSPAP